MTGWQISMLYLAAFIVAHFAWDVRPWHRVRTWIALFGAGFLGQYANATISNVDALMASYIALDLTAGAINLVRPAGLAQKAIGFCFAVMVLAHIGVIIASAVGPINTAIYDDLNTRLGWAQFLVLLLWSCDDVGKAVVRRLWPIRAVANPETSGGAS